MAKKQDDFDRRLVERLLVAAELYVLAVIRCGLRPAAETDAAKTVAVARKALLDEVERVHDERA